LEIPDTCLYAPNVAVLSCGSVLEYGSDQYRVHFACPINDFKIVIYNRWGEEMFKTKDVNETWNTNEVPDGVYVWIITGLMSEQGTPFSVKKTGHVTVLK
jgi:hypothetical protein